MTSVEFQGGVAVIEDGLIVIRFEIVALPVALDGKWSTNNEQTRYKITDGAEFAKELVGTLNEEDEQGTTLIHKMMDAAFDKTIEDGAFGIEEHEDQEGTVGEQKFDDAATKKESEDSSCPACGERRGHKLLCPRWLD